MGKVVRRKLKKRGNGNVALNTIITEEYYKKLAAIKKDRGFSSEQDVIRFAVKDFFNRNGF